MPVIASAYAAVLGLLFGVLSVRVIRVRGAENVALGDGGSERLRRAIRVHANFAEYVPLALILILLTELNGAPYWRVHLLGASLLAGRLLGASLLAGRLLHAWGVSRSPEMLGFRVAGMALTFAAIIAGSLLLLVSAVTA